MRLSVGLSYVIAAVCAVVPDPNLTDSWVVFQSYAGLCDNNRTGGAPWYAAARAGAQTQWRISDPAPLDINAACAPTAYPAYYARPAIDVARGLLWHETKQCPPAAAGVLLLWN